VVRQRHRYHEGAATVRGGNLAHGGLDNRKDCAIIREVAYLPCLFGEKQWATDFTYSLSTNESKTAN
jgi:hypothetical protein